MTNQKPIDLVLSRELVQQWRYEASNKAASITGNDGRFDYIDYIVTQAAQWGYNQRAAVNKAELQKARDEELEARCSWVSVHCSRWSDGTRPRDELYVARRPKPPSLKEQALDALGPEPLPAQGPTGDTILNMGAIQRHRLIRRALEQAND